MRISLSFLRICLPLLASSLLFGAPSNLQVDTKTRALTATDGGTIIDAKAVTLTLGGFTISDASGVKTVVLGSTSGTRFGATGNKIAFLGGTPIVRPSATTDLRLALINLGLYTTGGASPLNLNGGVFTSGPLSSTTGTFSGTLGVTGPITASSLTLSGNETIGGTLGVTGATSGSSFSYSGNGTVAGTFGVTGNSTFGGTLGITGLFIGSTGTFSGSLASGPFSATTGTFSSSLAATGNTTLGGTLAITGATSGSSFSFSGNGTIGGTFGVTGNTTVGGTLTVTGGFTGPTGTFSGALSSPNVSFTGGTLSGITSFAGGSMALTGNETVGGTLSITGATSGSAFSFTGNGTVGGTLGVTGNSTFGGTLSVTGNETVGGSLTVAGNVTTGQLKASKIGDRTIYASSVATLNSNVLTGGGTDVTAALNAVLDTFHLTGGGVLVLDGAALISAPLVVGDNTTIYSPNDSCGVYLATGSNSYMLKNRAITTLAPPPRPATYNKNIQIIGGTWNGNWAGQSAALANNISNFLTCGFAFAGVDNLVLDGLTVLNARRFAVLMAYLGNPNAQNLIIKWDSFHLTSNNDGLHFWGPITGTNTIRNIRGINGSDDLVALNYIESAWWSGNNNLFDDIPAAVNTLVDGVSTENSAGPVVIHGSSLDYRIFDPTIPDIDTSVGTITIRNLTASLNSTLHTGFALFASGRWDRLTVDNFKVKYPPTMPGLVAAYDRNVRIASYNPAAVTEFSHWQVSGATDDTQPFILYSGNSTSHALTLNDFHVTRTLGSPTGSLLYFSSGTDPDAMATDILNVRDCEITGFASLIFNGRPSAKLPLVYLDNNTLPPGTLAVDGLNPVSIVNGQFLLDPAGAALIPFVMSDIADIRPAGVPATVLWQQLSSLNFASVYGMRWQFNLSGYTNASQSRLSIAGGNNASGSYVTADVLSLFTGGGMVLGTGIVDPGSGNLALSGLTTSSFVKTDANKVLVSKTASQMRADLAMTSADVIGTTTNDSAPAGGIGEFVSASRASGSPLALTTGATANVTSITLTAGDWDVEGIVGYIVGGGTVVTDLVSGSAFISATIGNESSYISWGRVDSNSSYYAFNIPTSRYLLPSTSTIYLITRGTFSTNTLAAYGTIRARRAR